ncbi:MAG: glycosyltransferase [Anaerolineae bacterium]|nr:glycosyltransferase [Anaerolineae bacterium]
MNPLAIVTCYNRWSQTAALLGSLEATVSLSYLDLVIVDNGSRDGTPERLQEWQARRPKVHLELLPENLGTSRALNLAMQKYRRAGQDVLKIDNDVTFLRAGWLHGVKRFFQYCARIGRNVAMVSGHYPEIFAHKRTFGKETWEWHRIIHYYPSTGCAIWYNAGFVRKSGYFDVLAPEHLYGFEDLIMAAKAQSLGWEICAWEGWAIAHAHCGNSLGDVRNEQVARMRPLYEQRVRNLKLGLFYTGPDGIPIGGSEHGTSTSS